MGEQTPFVIIGNPDAPTEAARARIERFQAALVAAGRAPARVVGYRDLIAGRVALPEVVGRGAIVRIESPERDFALEREILALGAAQDDDEGDYARASRPEVAGLVDEVGAIHFPRQWYLGYREVLRRIGRQLATCPPHRLMNDPEEIALMFDKRRCHALLAEQGVAVPRGLGPVRCHEELLARMREARMPRVFVKLAHGSSASGVVAYQIAGERQQAMTTVEMVPTGTRHSGWEGVRLFNNRRVRVYRDHREIAALIDALCRHRVQVEQWVPKAGLGGRTLDLRVVVIGGEARHVVVRLSRHAMTNLHLSGGRTSGRAPLEALDGRLAPEAWSAARRTCERAMALFPKSLYAGIDLLIASDFRRHAIAEVNAFGDLLFNVWHEGQDTFAAEIGAALWMEKRRSD